MPVKVLVADDGAVLRRAIRNLLELDDEITLVGEAEDFKQVIQKAAELKPDVVLLDLRMPYRPDLTPELRNLLAPDSSHLLAMSYTIDDEAKEVAEKLGAQKLLDKMRLCDELIPAVKQVSAGGLLRSLR
jgi:DNA-binding NarL/FixJ family response regulator